MPYQPDPARYTAMTYNRCGRSGLKLPALSLGLWHNFGGVDPYENGRAMIRKAFDLGITHIDIANNYGPPPGSAEDAFGRILRQDFAGLRDELIISTKAGWKMWDGPYGDWGSRKYLVSSLDQSLKRLGLDYVDIFYHHRPDPETPLEETMAALDHIVRSGKALYAGISSYQADDTRRAAALLRSLGTPLLIHQPLYNIFNRWVEEKGLLDICDTEGVGVIGFCPLAQGLLTNRYLQGIPDGSRASKPNTFLKKQNVTDAVIAKVRKLDAIAKARGQSLAQMALTWLLRRKTVTSALIGASSPAQLEENVQALKAPPLTGTELKAIDKAAK